MVIFYHEIANWSYLAFVYVDYFGLVTGLGKDLQEDFFSEQRTVKHKGLELATFAADVHPAFRFEFDEHRLKFGDGFTKMVQFESVRGDFDDDSIKRVIDHFLKKLSLFPLPQISQRCKAQACTTKWINVYMFSTLSF